MMKSGFKALKVYRLSYSLAMRIFNESKTFPAEEKYSLTDQIRRSSRSVCVNISEAYRKRIYPAHFKSKMTDADAECSETLVWLDFAFDCDYLDKVSNKEILEGYNQVGKMIGFMVKNPEKFEPKSD